jgi:YbbR domain-containing protein
MIMQVFKSVSKWFSRTYNEFSRRKLSRDKEDIPQSERIIVFIFAFMIALSMWLLVNLGRDFNLTLNLPVMHADPPEGRAFITEIPRNANTTVSGEGWKLISIYNNPPQVIVPVEEGTINVFEAVQASLSNFPDVSVSKVQPMIVNVNTEEKMEKRIPVRNEVTIETRRRFNVIGSISITPDSVTVSGARSLVEPIESWPTEARELEDVKENLDIEVQLRRAQRLIQLNTEQVRIKAEIAEFTEGEVRIPVVTRNLPPGRRVSYSPSVLTVRYDVPITQYNEASSVIPFQAYVNYSTIVNDTTGYVTPQIEPVIEDLDVRLRSYQPRRVSYFNVVAQ